MGKLVEEMRTEWEVCSTKLNYCRIHPRSHFVKIYKKYDIFLFSMQMLSLCDLVLNHTANETPWLKTNPETCYNLANSPHLRPAYLLECVMNQFDYDISQGKYTPRGLPPNINSDKHLSVMKLLLMCDSTIKAGTI